MTSSSYPAGLPAPHLEVHEQTGEVAVAAYGLAAFIGLMLVVTVAPLVGLLAGAGFAALAWFALRHVTTGRLTWDGQTIWIDRGRGRRDPVAQRGEGELRRGQVMTRNGRVLKQVYVDGAGRVTNALVGSTFAASEMDRLFAQAGIPVRDLGQVSAAESATLLSRPDPAAKTAAPSPSSSRSRCSSRISWARACWAERLRQRLAEPAQRAPLSRASRRP